MSTEDDNGAPISGADPDATDNSSTATATETVSAGQPLSVAFDVPLIPQPTQVSCWAASLAMVISYRDKACYTVEQVADLVSMSLSSGYNWSAISNAVAAWKLQQEGSACGLPSYWAGLLQNNGPLWIVEAGKPTHAVVLVGISGDDTPEGTTVTLNNPWPPEQGVVETKTFAAFERDFELGVAARAMVVHG